jgi:hypothetical protein
MVSERSQNTISIAHASSSTLHRESLESKVGTGAWWMRTQSGGLCVGGACALWPLHASCWEWNGACALWPLHASCWEWNGACAVLLPSTPHVGNARALSWPFYMMLFCFPQLALSQFFDSLYLTFAADNRLIIHLYNNHIFQPDRENLPLCVIVHKNITAI